MQLIHKIKKRKKTLKGSVSIWLIYCLVPSLHYPLCTRPYAIRPLHSFSPPSILASSHYTGFDHKEEEGKEEVVGEADGDDKVLMPLGDVRT